MKILKPISAFLLLFSFLICFLPILASANEVTIKNVSAKSSCLIEAESGRVLYSKNATQRMAMASTTKIMTAIVALESEIPLDRVIKVPKEAVGVEGSSVYLKHNENITFEMLLYALMLSSANDAAVAIALTVSNSLDDFVDLMNKKAQNLGLVDTHFTNPHGLYDEDHYTTAQELAKIMAYAMQNDVFAKITSCKQIAFKRDDGTSFLWTNHNRLLKSNDGVIGGKTGFTKKSGRCLVSCAERDGLRLIAVTLNAPDDWNDHSQLYGFGFANYQKVHFDSQNFKIPVISGTKSEVGVFSNDFSLVMPKGHNTIDIRINAPRFLFAEIKQGEKIGDITYLCGGNIIATTPLYAQENVTQLKYKFNLFSWLIDFIKRIFN